MRLRPLVLLPVLLVLALALAACGGEDEPESAPEPTTEPTTPQATQAAEGPCEDVGTPEPKEDGGQAKPVGTLDAGKTYLLHVETSCGDFTIELDQKSAPQATASLVTLAENGFYDGTTFHRVVPGFVIQGGDPTGTGTGGPGYSTVDLPATGTTYTLGTVAMAKAGNEPAGTSGSQFFVVTAPDAGLPPDYAVVGSVTEGMETVTAIESLGVGDGPPSQPVVIEKVTVESS
jgi:peptidyl-prolyl cis-trans isomerase B (cyclophilin B)